MNIQRCARTSLFLCALFVGAILSIRVQAMLIPPFFINSVVALGGIQPISIPGQPPRNEWQTAGTGFFYGSLIKDDPDIKKRGYEIYLVTARHVVEQYISSGRGNLNVRINPKEATKEIQQFSVSTNPKPGEATWFFHPRSEIDVAVVRVDFNFLKAFGYEPDFFTNDQSAMTTEKLSEAQVAAGDGVFVLGFPMNLAGIQRNYVIVREGIIARISEMLEHASNTFMIDASVYPGNSGGPVILRPEIISIENTKPQPKAALIGLVTSYRPYTDIAVSPQTGNPRIVFQENSRLADVLPVNFIDETIRAWRDSQGLKNGELTPSASPKKSGD